MECRGPAAEALSYPGVPGRPVLPAGVRLTESGAKAPAESVLLALLQQICRGNIRNVYSKDWTRELIHSNKSMKTPLTSVMANWLMFLDGK